MDAQLFNQLRSAEEFHLQPEPRRDRESLDAILDDAFTEIGASGARYTKQDVLDALPSEAPSTRTVQQFDARQLAADLYLTTYTLTTQAPNGAPPSHSHRSTIWRREQGVLRMLFHQGTPTT